MTKLDAQTCTNYAQTISKNFMINFQYERGGGGLPCLQPSSVTPQLRGGDAYAKDTRTIGIGAADPKK